MNEAEAREVAQDWHGGQWSPLYAFASTGTLVEGITNEIGDNIRWCEDQAGSPRLEDYEDAQVQLERLHGLAAFVREGFAKMRETREIHTLWVQEDAKMAADYMADGDTQGARQSLERALEHLDHLEGKGGGE